MCVELPKLVLTCAYGVIEIIVSMSALGVPTAPRGCMRQARAMQVSMNARIGACNLDPKSLHRRALCCLGLRSLYARLALWLGL